MAMKIKSIFSDKIKSSIAILLLLCSMSFPYYSCNRVPVTGRRQVNLLPESQLMSMSLTNYNEFLRNHQVVRNTQEARMVKEVGNKIASAVEEFLKKKGKANRVKGYQWEFNLVKDKTANAWAMPGGKVVVYTGLLNITENETGLAVVMAHEVAHAIARHGNERMSQQLLVQLGGQTLGAAMDESPETTKKIFMTSYGIGTTLGSLAYSRKHEAEADKMGLVFMAMAGYNPKEAIDFWKRMAEKGGASPPEFLSTHPSNESRIEEIKEFLPEAMKYYNENLSQK